MLVRFARTAGPGATLKVYSGGAHGLAVIRKDQLNAGLLAFVNG